jgi:threonine aldolase
MTHYSFKNDYSEGAHPNILKALADTNLIQEDGYSLDSFSSQARELIKTRINAPNSDVHFVSGGTQANLIVISSVLKPHQSVIAATTAHIAVHEAGAIEATGHKICTVPTSDGKLTVDHIQSILNEHTDEHMVQPKLVFISNSTEVGSIYTKSELQKISDYCRKNDLILYLDGARLGSALSSKASDLTIEDITQLVDIYYIGGTKNGALLGEAIVINRDDLKEDFRFYLKQKGALLAKGRLIGIQFLELFKDDLFFQLANHANQMASEIAEAIKQAGYEFLAAPVSNQVFPVLPNQVIEKLSQKYGFYVWQKIDDNQSAIRLVTSWATPQEVVAQFIQDLA